jgi:threonine dehydrogenase-like Zn-dependent dehydrogenase
MAFTLRAGIKPGVPFSIAILGAGLKGGVATIHFAKFLGATEIVAISDFPSALERAVKIGATSTIEIGMKLKDARNDDFSTAENVDFVLDYCFNKRTDIVLWEIMRARNDPTHSLTWAKLEGLGAIL